MGSGFFHRDIKPANIMLCPDGKLVLIDFGTARQVTQTVVNGQSVTVVYSLGYTAPEQLDGHAVLQSDFYSLGRTFIYLLTGIDPAGDRSKDFRNWYKFVKDQKTPKRFIDLIQAMTDSRPDRRPATAQAILEKLENIEQHPRVQWSKLLLSVTCGFVLLFSATWVYQKMSATWVYQKMTLLESCDRILDDHLSCGEESLIPRASWGKSRPQRIKQSAIEQYRSQNLLEAVRLFTTVFEQMSDPETLIYLNNAKIQSKFKADQIHTIAVAVPLESLTPIALEILRGVAQAQNEVLEKGQPLRIIIADDNNSDNNKFGHNAPSIAQRLVKYQDLLAVVGHNSSETTKKTIPIYQQAELVLISPTSTSDNLKSPFFFRTVHSDRVAAKQMAAYVFSQLKQNKAAIFYSKGGEYAESLSRAFRVAAKSLQGNAIADQPAFNLASDDFKAPEALKQAQIQGATVIVLIPDAGVGLSDAIYRTEYIRQEPEYRKGILCDWRMNNRV